MPIRVALDRVQDPSLSHPCDQLHNVSLGGLAFQSPEPLANQQIVNISFPLLDETHRFHGRVVWSRKLKQGYEIGLQFDDEELSDDVSLLGAQGAANDRTDLPYRALPGTGAAATGPIDDDRTGRKGMD